MSKSVDTTADNSTSRSSDADEREVTPRMPPPVTAARGRQLPSWNDKIEKLTIGSLDQTTLSVVAQYNPKELQFEKQIPWKVPDRLPAGHLPRNGQDEVEITSTPTRSITIELLFDGYEQHRSVQPEIDKLEVMSSIQVPGSKEAAERRPHHCVVAWGENGTRPFRCVIESLSTKLTMFAPSGAPLRAVCTVKLKEVTVLTKVGERWTRS